MARPWADLSQEEKRERQQQRLDETHQRLQGQIRQLRTGEDWQRWLDVAAKFPDRSFNNQLLILAQKPDATLVAGYRAWQDMGRQVQKGESGIRVLAPITRKVPVEEQDRQATGEDETGVAASRRVVGYKTASVFDISQTEGDPLPEPPGPQLLQGQAPTGLWDNLAAAAAEAGFTVQRGDTGDPHTHGYTHYPSRTIRVRDDVDDAQAAGTLAHELAHARMHTPDQLGADHTAHCRGVREVEAESVAYLISAQAGLDTSGRTFGYVTGWASAVDAQHPEQVVADTGGRVVTHAGQVLTRLHTLEQERQQAPTPESQHAQHAQRGQLAAHTDTGVKRTASNQHRAHTHAPTAQQREQTHPEHGPDRRRLIAAHAAAVEFYRHQLLDTDGGRGPRDYLTTRGLAHTLERDSPWQVGYAPPTWRDLYTHLRRKDFTDDELEAAGLVTRSRTGAHIDRFRDRIMLPIRNHDGQTVGFAGRASPDATSETPKYLNTPTTAIYDKSQLLYGLADVGHRGPPLPLEPAAHLPRGQPGRAAVGRPGAGRTRPRADHPPGAHAGRPARTRHEHRHPRDRRRVHQRPERHRASWLAGTGGQTCTTSRRPRRGRWLPRSPPQSQTRAPLSTTLRGTSRAIPRGRPPTNPNAPHSRDHEQAPDGAN